MRWLLKVAKSEQGSTGTEALRGAEVSGTVQTDTYMGTPRSSQSEIKPDPVTRYRSEDVD